MYIYLKKYKINIPNIKDIGIYEKYKYIVMELLQVTLKEYVNKTTDMEKLIYYMFDLIKPFHERMLVHRDIKPENFIFDNKWNIYIIDLGLSTFVSERRMNTFIGNKLYASYNCHLSEYIYRQKDDLISIVYMLLHLYTGALPWDKTPFDHTYQIKSKPRSLFNLDYILENKFNSDSHSNYYNLKKNTNYVEFYKKIEKYDENVSYLLDIYDHIH
jgi:serine/threonine protein kinase